MKNLFKLFTFLLITVFISSCTKKFDEINTNPKALTLSSLNQASYGFVVKKSIIGISYLEPYGGTMQILHSLFFDVYANYFATSTPNFLSDRYVMVGSWLDGDFQGFYADQAPQVKYAEDFARTKKLDIELGMMKIWKVWSYHRYTDALGPIPYSQYGNMKRTVPYDPQADIYASFFAELDSANTLLKNASGNSATLASYDPIYGGDRLKWQKFGNSLRLRLALRVKYVLPAESKAQAEKAFAEGVITNNADNGWVTTTADNQNPYNIISPWVEYRMSADMESILKGYADPRVQSYYSPALQPDATDDAPLAAGDFPYEGMRNGQTKNNRSAIAFDKFTSDMAYPFTIVGDKGPSWFIMRAAESYFLRAEGALEGWSMGGTAADLYKTGIETSLAENGFTDNLNLLGAEYATSTLVPSSPGADASAPTVVQAPVSTAPVAFRTGGTKEQQLEQIITQKWIGLWPDSQEAYAERRRTHYPILFNRLESENLDVPATSLPVRLTYWTSEYTNNADEVANAITKLNAESATPNGDKASTKLWWDKK
ncbi:MAG: SusD/RagB family nutrient-binding outer membrane lipoprotein [Bacteroidota bacterium]